MSTYPVKIVRKDRLIGWTILQDTAMSLYPSHPTDKTIALLKYNIEVCKTFSEQYVKKEMKKELKHFIKDHYFNLEVAKDWYKGHIEDRWEENFGDPLSLKEFKRIFLNAKSSIISEKQNKLNQS